MEENYGFKSEFLPTAPPIPSYPTVYPPLSTDINSTFNPQLMSDSHCSVNNSIPISTYNPSQPFNNNKAFRWVSLSTSYGGIPPGALQGGVDADGHAIFVGRAYLNGDWIPAKVIPGKNAAYVAYDGGEHIVDQFEVLCEQKFQWVCTSGSNIPFGAVEGGRTSDGESLYIGRVLHNGSQTIGKVHPSHENCYIPFDGQEIAYRDYEILVLRT